MELKLKILAGAKAGREIAIAPGKFFIGRAEDCQLRPHSDLVSRHHCAISFDGSIASIRDFGSKNGTFVNGTRVSGETDLKAGDRIEVGPLHFEVVLTTGVGGAKKPAVRDVREAVARLAQGGGDQGRTIEEWLAPSDSDMGSTLALPPRPASPLESTDGETHSLAMSQTQKVVSPTPGGRSPQSHVVHAPERIRSPHIATGTAVNDAANRGTPDEEESRNPLSQPREPAAGAAVPPAGATVKPGVIGPPQGVGPVEPVPPSPTTYPAMGPYGPAPYAPAGYLPYPPPAPFGQAPYCPPAPPMAPGQQPAGWAWPGYPAQGAPGYPPPVYPPGLAAAPGPSSGMPYPAVPPHAYGSGYGPAYGGGYPPPPYAPGMPADAAAGSSPPKANPTERPAEAPAVRNRTRLPEMLEPVSPQDVDPASASRTNPPSALEAPVEKAHPKPNYFVPEAHESTGAEGKKGDKESQKPSFAVPAPADSCSAAADTLKRMFGRR